MRIFKKKNDKLKAILNDKNLIESNDLKTKLDICERELDNQNQRCKVNTIDFKLIFISYYNLFLYLYERESFYE